MQHPRHSVVAWLAILLVCSAGAAPPPAARRTNDPNVLAAEDFLQHGEYAKAAEALELVLRLRPKEDPELYIMLAVCRVNLKDRTAALNVCDQGLRAIPANARIENYCASLMSDTLTGAALIARLDAALATHPDSGILQKALGRALLDSRSADSRTGQLLANARKVLPGDAEAHFLYGQWACLRQQESACVQALNSALALTAPDNYVALVLINGMLGVARDRLSQPRLATAAFERALAAYGKLEPPVPEVPYQYVRFLLARSDLAAAQRVNKEILRRNPQFAPAHLEQAQFHFRAGRVEPAIEEANLALGYAPADKTLLRAIHVFLVKAYSALGREAEAREHQQWVDSNP